MFSRVFEVGLRVQGLRFRVRYVSVPQSPRDHVTTLLGSPFDLVSRVSSVRHGDVVRVSRGY